MSHREYYRAKANNQSDINHGMMNIEVEAAHVDSARRRMAAGLPLNRAERRAIERKRHE